MIETRIISPAAALGCAVLCAVLYSMVATGCDRASSQASPIPGVRIADAPAQPDQTYTTRGRIYNIPAGGPTEEFLIAHETIPDFVDINGDVVGMNAMIMPFPAVTADVPLETLAEGQNVEFDFAVDWDGDARWVITRLVVLPDDAEVDLAGVWPGEPAAEADAMGEGGDAGEPETSPAGDD